MRIGLLWLVPLFTLTEGTDGFLQKNDGRRTKEIVSMVEERHPGKTPLEVLEHWTLRPRKQSSHLSNGPVILGTL